MRLLLDGQFSPAVSRPLRANGIDVFTLDEWHDAEFRNTTDDTILTMAAAEARTLVTYDVKSINLLLRAWASKVVQTRSEPLDLS
jgi:predicted nuclease of predicted toxin-antitoxin system